MKPGLLMLPSAVSDSRVHNILPNKIETDFQFSRASAATRVNHQGLIENVGYFSSELVQNGNFSELGSELVVNGSFESNSDWTNFGTPTTSEQSTNKAYIGNYSWHIIGTAFRQGIFSPNNFSLVNGKTYKASLWIYAVDGVEIQSGVTNSDAGVFTSRAVTRGEWTNVVYYFTANASSASYISILTSSSTLEFYVDNVSVKQVDPNDRWTLGTGWSYGDGVASRTSQSGSSLLSSNSFTLTVGKTYKCTMTVSNYSNGGVRFATDNVGFTVHSANGTYTEILTSTGTVFSLKGNADFAGSVSNISIVEVQGDKPRLDYDPLNPTCPHLLLEPQSTNLVTFSNDYTQTFWVKQQAGTASVPVVTSNYAISPDGTRNADRVIFNLNGATNSDFSQLAASLTTSVGNITNSVYIKSNTDSNYVMNFTKASGASEIITVTNEWQRFEATLNNSTTSSAFRIRLRGNESTSDYADVSIYGAQLEQQAYATSLIPTAGAAETRVSETCTNAGNVDTFNSTEGVLYCEIAALANDGVNKYISINNGGTTDYIFLRYRSDNDFQVKLRSGNTDKVNQTFTLLNNLNYNKIAFSYKVNQFKIFVNGLQVGSTVTTGATSTTGTLNNVDFESFDGANDFYGKVKGLATYNRALTDTELYTITSTQYSAYSGMVAALGNYTIPC